MEDVLRLFAGYSALLLEAVVVVVVVAGAVQALVRVGMRGPQRASRWTRRRIWMQFAQWIVLALEFALGADIIRTSIAPTWDDVGKLAAIAAIRTGLSLFLARDIGELGPLAESPAVDSPPRQGGP